MMTIIIILLFANAIILFRHLLNYVEIGEYTCKKLNSIEDELKKLNDKI